MNDQTTFPYIYECQFCHFPAFYLKEGVKLGQAVLAENIGYLNGTVAKTGDPIICGSCSTPLPTVAISNVKLLQ